MTLRRTELSLAGNKGARQRHLPCPSPSQNPKGNQFLPGNLLASRKHPTLCFCGSIPLVMGLTPSTNIPAPQDWQCASSPDGPRHPTVNPAPRRGEEKAHTSLTVAPEVGWGQTSGRTVAPPTDSSYTPQHRGSALQVLTMPGTIQSDQAEEFPSEESPGNNNS